MASNPEPNTHVTQTLQAMGFSHDLIQKAFTLHQKHHGTACTIQSLMEVIFRLQKIEKAKEIAKRQSRPTETTVGWCYATINDVLCKVYLLQDSFSNGYRIAAISMATKYEEDLLIANDIG